MATDMKSSVRRYAVWFFFPTVSQFFCRPVGIGKYINKMNYLAKSDKLQEYENLLLSISNLVVDLYFNCNCIMLLRLRMWLWLIVTMIFMCMLYWGFSPKTWAISMYHYCGTHNYCMALLCWRWLFLIINTSMIT